MPWMGCKTYIMNVQTETNKDEENSLVNNHDKAKVLATVITTFNKHMECVVEEHGQQHVVTYSLKAGINKFGNQAKASAHKEMKQLTHFYRRLRLCSCGTKPQHSKNHPSVMMSSCEPQCHHDIIMRTPRIMGKPRFSCSRGPKSPLTKIPLL